MVQQGEKLISWPPPNPFLWLPSTARTGVTMRKVPVATAGDVWWWGAVGHSLVVGSASP